jgi:hypothetical protein
MAAWAQRLEKEEREGRRAGSGEEKREGCRHIGAS